MRTYVPGEARLPAVHNQLMERDEFVDEIQDRLEQVQQLYKTNYDRNHRDVEYQVGQWVWLQLLHHPMASLNIHGRGKLGTKYDGPFQVLERVSFVTYKLQLPLGCQAARRVPRQANKEILRRHAIGAGHTASYARIFEMKGNKCWGNGDEWNAVMYTLN
jgi:hypothetical protein